ncbi:proline dehydrogenase subunit delta [Clostridia bacterium]|nr:proline dehydrogenase subunit delta [Clostridia bacterium]GHU75835.1 proline dehydrogenase subunit delta [Clostridia bacterium]
MTNRGTPKGEFLSKQGDDIIVCRCEEITKGEIRRAVFDGMFTISEIRRYLRAGMGLCQGRTCYRLVKNILEGELGREAAETHAARAPVRAVSMEVLARYEK